MTTIDFAHLRTMLEDARPGHSHFQLDHWVIARSGGTTYGMYKQALRELRGRYQGLVELYVKRQELEHERRFSLKRAAMRLVGRGALHDVRFSMTWDDLEGQIATTERELARLYQHATHLKAHLGDLSPERIEEFEAEHYLHKLKTKCATEIVTDQKLSEGTLELVMSLPRANRAELFALITPSGHMQLLHWLHNYEPEVDIERATPAPSVEGGLSDALLALGSR